MKRFYSPSADQARGGWFDEGRHGACEIKVIDKAKQAESLKRAATKDEADYKAAVAANDDPKLIINPANYQERQARIIANPIMKIIANPDCMIPNDAIEVSDDDYAALMEAQSAGQMIVVDPSKRAALMAIDRPVSNEQILTSLRRRRNTALRESDWTELPRVRLTEKDRKSWEAYRDALKDLPAKAQAALDAGAPHDQIAEMFPKAPAD